MAKTAEKTVKVSVRLPDSIYKQAKHAATDRDLTMNDYLLLAIARANSTGPRAKEISS